MNDTTYNILQPDVRTAAKTTAREWADVIDADDAEQEIWFRILESSADYSEEIASLDKPARVRVLTEIGHQVALNYRDDFELFSGNHTYGTRQVRQMLGRDALAGVHEGSGVPIWELPQPIIKQLERTDTETVTERIDLFIGMHRLEERNARYVYVIVQAFVKDEWDRTNNGMELTRAVDALTREMNRTNRRRKAEYTDGPGTRRVISNAEAQKITRNQ